MATRIYRLYCQHCHYNRITDGTDCNDLVEVKQSKIQGNMPYWNKEKSEVENPSYLSRPKKFKCPGCGRCISPVKIKESQDTLNEQEE